MSTPENYALAAASSANDALLSALLATAKSVLTSEDQVAAAQWAADAYTYMLNSSSSVNIVNNNSAIESSILSLASDFSSKYLGSRTTHPITNIVGVQYWNSTESLMYTWNGTSWIIPTPIFDGNVNAGTSSVPNGKVQLRRDLAGSWTVANPILGLGELGIESDTGFIKIGNGTSNWINLTYSGSPKSAVSGINNIDNTSDINKPVSTAQASAIQVALNSAKSYTDSSKENHLIDVGEYAVNITNAYPITGGSGANGLILKGNVFNIIGFGTINSKILNQGDSLRALVDSPTQDDNDWAVTINSVVVSKPYILILNIPGLTIPDYYYPLHIFTVPVSYTLNFSSSIAKSKAYPLSPFVFYILKNNVQVGTVTFAAGSLNGVFSSVEPFSVTAGDTLEFVSQLASDPVFSNISISLYGTRI